MIENGHKIINDLSEADYIIINSCGFTKNYEDRSINLFKEIYPKKEKKATIIMFGCLVKINQKLIDSLDLYPIDYDDGEKFDEIFYKKIKFEDIKPYCDTKNFEKQFFNKIIIQPSKKIPIFLSRLMLPFSKKLRTNYQRVINDLITKNKILIEISKGCASNCKFCTIKKARGNICSRQINDIINDIEKLYDPKKELFLVADDCTSYGLDIKTNLFSLLYEIKKKFPDLLINLDNLNPYWLEKYPDIYIKLFSEFNICYATIPLQSGSNRILKDMNRNYNIKKIRNIIKKIKMVSPKTIIYTHFIICYPKEKIIDFLKSIYSSLYFDLSIVFIYSEPKDSISLGLSNHKSRFVRIYRLVFFKLFQNFVTFYKLLILPITSK
jgi:tRNA A37 methylthiotransferase MiaB